MSDSGEGMPGAVVEAMALEDIGENLAFSFAVSEPDAVLGWNGIYITGNHGVQIPKKILGFRPCPYSHSALHR